MLAYLRWAACGVLASWVTVAPAQSPPPADPEPPPAAAASSAEDPPPARIIDPTVAPAPPPAWTPPPRALLRIQPVAPRSASGAAASLPADYRLLERQLGGVPVTTAVTIQGVTYVRGYARSYLIWATSRNLQLGAEGGCVRQWDAVQVFVGMNVGSVAPGPWASDQASLELCFYATGPRFSVRGVGSIDDFDWGALEFADELVYQPLAPRDLPPSGEVPRDVLPPPLRPLRLSYVPGEPDPPGYVYQQKAYSGFAIGGAFAFGVPYLVPILVITSLDANPGWMTLPVFGPVVTWGIWVHGLNNDCGDNCDLRNLGVGYATVFLFADTIVQAAGVTGIIVGLVAKKRWWERADSGRTWSIAPLPVTLGSGLRLSVKF